MGKRILAVVVTGILVGTGAAYAQYPIIDMAANRVIQKYQGMTCEQLWAQKGQPKSQEEQNVINFLRNDPQARTVFINQVAGPVVNKMFECGMVP